MNKKPIVSVIIPIYGVEKYISQCVTSVLNQTYENIEIILVNDCTKDNSMELVKICLKSYFEKQHKIKIINHTTNEGLASARYTGIDASSGEYIFHLDSDDWLEPNAISLLVEKALSSNADMVVGDFYMNYENSGFIQEVGIADKNEYIKYILERNRNYSWTIWNRLIRRSIQLKAMPINNLNMGEDFVTVPRLIYYCRKICKISIPLYHYRQTNSTSYTKSITYKSIEDLVKAVHVLQDFFERKDKHENYLNSLRQGKIKLKYEICLRSNKDTYPLLNNIFPDITYHDPSNLMQKLILFLVECKMLRLMSAVAKTGLIIKRNIRMIIRK